MLPCRSYHDAIHGAAFLLPTKGVTGLTLHSPRGRIALDHDKLQTLRAALVGGMAAAE